MEENNNYGGKGLERFEDGLQRALVQTLWHHHQASMSLINYLRTHLNDVLKSMEPYSSIA